jgi:photosystem II stability/assembly factor-like uncharacterized protein
MVPVGLALALILCLLACLPAPMGAQIFNRDVYSYRIAHREVTSVFFLDSARGWLTLLDHTRHRSYLFQTRDGGRTWRSRGAPWGLSHLYFLNSRLGWGLTYETASRGFTGWLGTEPDGSATVYLVRTRDGGKTWVRVFPTHAPPATIAAVAFATDEDGWLVGGGPDGTGIVLKAAEGGRQVRRAAGLPEDLQACLGVYASRAVGVWVYGAGFVLHSGDEGMTWERPPGIMSLGIKPDSFWISSAFFLDSGRGWLAGNGPDWSLLVTNDLGRHWRRAAGSWGGAALLDVWFSDPQHGCAAGASTTLFCTADGGSTWDARNVLPAREEGQADFFTKVVMLGSGRGWVLRAGGFLYETTDGGQTWRPFDPLEGAKRP